MAARRLYAVAVRGWRGEGAGSARGVSGLHAPLLSHPLYLGSFCPNRSDLWPGPSPSLSHIASTLCFVAASISITLAQLRVTPSSGHSHLASIPISTAY